MDASIPVVEGQQSHLLGLLIDVVIIKFHQSTTVRAPNRRIKSTAERSFNRFLSYESALAAEVVGVACFHIFQFC
ncbi:hypothetical protein BJL96_12600 [Burkholderia cenocepacia]|nr:hypothetical protein [Burkholderia cenocepacia]DAG84131.1 MAG TPA: hypothetical protein [Caudoviricetes sp.]